MANTGKHGKGKRRKTAFQPHKQSISFAPAPDPQSPMGRVTLEDGARFRAYPYLLEFVRPLLPGEFGDRQVVSEERMRECTHIFVTRIDPTSVARTRIPITTEQAEFYQAFGILEKEELQAGSPQERNNGPFALPEETQQLTIVAATNGMLPAFQDYPHIEQVERTVELRAKEIADLRVRIWPDISNDREMYTRLFVSAFVFGYRYGHTIIQEATGQERTMLLQGVCFRPSLDAQNTIAQVLRDRMKELHVSSIYELS